MQCADRDNVITPADIVFNDTHHTTAKLIDFGFAGIQNGDELFKECCGTLIMNATAPEIIETFLKKRSGHVWTQLRHVGCGVCFVLHALCIRAVLPGPFTNI